MSGIAEVRGIIEKRDGKQYWKPEQPPFPDRVYAGALLGDCLVQAYGIAELANAVVVGCPRGGMLYAQGIVEAIRKAGGCPALDLVICRKISRPDDEEFGVGAVTEQGKPILIDRLVRQFQDVLSAPVLEERIAKAQAEVRRRVEAYRQGSPALSLAGKVVVLTDTVVSGGTMIACIESIRTMAPRRIIIATPLITELGRNTIIEATHLPKEDLCAVVEAAPPKGTFWNSDDFYQPTETWHQMTDQEVTGLVHAYRVLVT